MIGKLVSALAGRAVAKRIGGSQAGLSGALGGLGVQAARKRFGVKGLVLAAAGTWAAGKLVQRYQDRRAGDSTLAATGTPRDGSGFDRVG